MMNIEVYGSSIKNLGIANKLKEHLEETNSPKVALNIIITDFVIEIKPVPFDIDYPDYTSNNKLIVPEIIEIETWSNTMVKFSFLNELFTAHIVKDVTLISGGRSK